MVLTLVWITENRHFGIFSVLGQWKSIVSGPETLVGKGSHEESWMQRKGLCLGFGQHAGAWRKGAVNSTCPCAGPSCTSTSVPGHWVLWNKIPAELNSGQHTATLALPQECHSSLTEGVNPVNWWKVTTFPGSAISSRNLLHRATLTPGRGTALATLLYLFSQWRHYLLVHAQVLLPSPRERFSTSSVPLFFVLCSVSHLPPPLHPSICEPPSFSLTRSTLH
jgi:hypothetical protein